MADDMNTTNPPSGLDSLFTNVDSSVNQILGHQQSIDQNLTDIRQILSSDMSQTNARRYYANKAAERSTTERNNPDRYYRDKYRDRYSRDNSSKRKVPGSFSEGIGEALTDAVLGADFKDKLGKSLSNFADLLGGQVEDIPGLLGKEIGNQLLRKVKDTKLGKDVFGKIDAAKSNIASRIQQSGQNFKDAYKQSTGVDVDDVLHKTKSAEDIKDEKIPPSQVKSGQSQSKSPNVEDVTDSSLSSTVDTVKDTVFDQIFDQAGNFLKDQAGSILQGLSGKGGLIGTLADKGLSFIGSGAGQAVAGASGAVEATTALSTTTGTAMAGATTAASSTAAAGALSSLAAAVGPLIPPLLAVTAAMIVLEALTEAFGPAIEGTIKLFSSLNDAANREASERKKRQENEQKRMEADIESMVRAPFKILEDAATALYQAWDNNIRMINGTQGYTKDQLQDLIGSYAERLRQEDLASVVSSADITNNLAKVLESGLSGAAAEEFAYRASILNAAIPNQDFFNYSDTYVSLAAQAQAQGKSQAEALDYANQQLELFASGVLYASRQLTGGFTTGLKDAQSLFESAVKIAQTSRTGDPAEIASVLTAVSAVTGSIAPDLASSMTDAIVQAATGGNSSQLVALRSLAGINASNTEFLQALAKDPQKVFSDMFSGLAEMQNMSNDNYMEVAEALSDVFGISMEAFARIDFNQLSNAIQNMDLSSASLQENLSHLASGETTTTAEQLRMQQINEYMINEGLAYVLDNEVARSIQEHMWEEQIANELMENTFAVELKGAALEFLEGIRQTIDNIIGLLNPFSWVNKIVNMVGTAQEGIAQEADIRQLLELGKIGNGNPQSLYQLTTRGVDLNITPDIISLMGGQSFYQMASGNRKFWNNITNPGSWMWSSDNLTGAALALTQFNAGRSFGSRGNAYTWGGIGKSSASILQSTYNPSTSPSYSSDIPQTDTSSEDANIAAINKALAQLTDSEYVESFVKENKDYSEWVKTAKNFGISDLATALETVGRTESDLEMLYQQYQTKEGADRERQRLETEEAFWSNTQQNQVLQHELTTAGNDLLQQLLDTTTEFKSLFDDYFIKHTYYDQSGYDYTKVSEIQRKEATGEQDAIYALASALTQNTVDLRDPTVQTNAILAQILIVVQAIMQQNNTTGKLTIPDSIAAMASGMFKLE